MHFEHPQNDWQTADMARRAKGWLVRWDWVFLVSGFLPMFIYGAAFGNILHGVGFHFGWNGQHYQGSSFFSYLLNLFAILCGLMSVALSVYQGGVMLMLRAENPIYERTRRYAFFGALTAAVLFIIGDIYISGMKEFVFTAPVDPAMPAAPMHGQHGWRSPRNPYEQSHSGIVEWPWLMGWHHRDSCCDHVPVFHAVHHSAGPEPDHLEQLRQRLRPDLHACGGSYLCTHHPLLHLMVLLRDARQGSYG